MQAPIERTRTARQFPASAAGHRCRRQQRRLATRPALAIAATAILSACASSGPAAPTAPSAPETVAKRAQFRAIPEGSAILVIGLAGNLDSGERSTARKRSGERVAGQAAAGTAGALGGAVLGATGGAIAGLVACGPLALICSPLAAVVGAVGGSAGGAVLGVGLTRGSASKRDDMPPPPAPLRDVVSEVAAGLAHSAPLVSAFEHEVDGHWIIGAGQSAAGVVMLEIEGFFFSRGHKQTYSMEVVSSMTVAYPEGDAEAEMTVPLRLSYVSEAHSVEEWAAEDAAVVRAELDTALTRHAAAMTEMLIDPRAALNAEL